MNVCRYQNPILVFIFKHFLECYCPRNWEESGDSERVTVSFLLQSEDCSPRRSYGYHAVHPTVPGHTYCCSSPYWSELGHTHLRSRPQLPTTQKCLYQSIASQTAGTPSSSCSPQLSSCTAAPASRLFLKHQAHRCLRHHHPCWKLHSPNTHGVSSSLCSGLFSKVISSARPAQAARANVSVHHLKCYIIFVSYISLCFVFHLKW